MTVIAPSAVEADALSTAAFCKPEILASVQEISYFLMERSNYGTKVRASAVNGSKE